MILKKTGLAYSVDVSLECWESCERSDCARPSDEKGQIGTSDVALLDLTDAALVERVGSRK